MSAVTSPYAVPCTDMLSESVYNFTAASSQTRRSSSSSGAAAGNSADQDCCSDSQLYDNSSTKLQLAASIQSSQSTTTSQVSSLQDVQQQQNKPRNKRKNFKPISSRMAEISDESDDAGCQEEGVRSPGINNEKSNDVVGVDYEVKNILRQENDSRKTAGQGQQQQQPVVGQQISRAQGTQRLNNNEIIPMDLSLATATTRPPSSEGDEEDTDDSFRHKFILDQLQSHKLFTDAMRSPTSESSGRSTRSTLEPEQMDDEHQHQQAALESEENSTAINNQDEAAPYLENKPFENMREYAESTMQELLAIYGLTGSCSSSTELARNVNAQLTPNLHNLYSKEAAAKVKVKEDKEASTTAPGSPPTPPHTPQSPSRQFQSTNNCSSSGGGSSSSSSSNSITSLSVGLNDQPSIHQAAAAAAAAAAAVIASGLHPGLAGSPLKQILVQNPALAQLLQQNPAILSQNPQLAQLLQQNLQANLIQGKLSSDDADEIMGRIPPQSSSSNSLAVMKVLEGIDPQVSALLRQSMSPVPAELQLLSTSSISTKRSGGGGGGGGGGGSANSSGGGSTSQQQHQQQQQQPIIDYSRYVRRYGSGQECGNSYCKELGCREHFHCLDCGGGGGGGVGGGGPGGCSPRVFVKKEEMIRHFKWHKKRDESLQHGFMRYSPTDDCAERYPGRHCPHNRKQTHYHCIHDNCDKVYISTSDVQMHANYHRKDSAIIQEGFQRFRATENCATEYCPFVGQRTTHFHCRRPSCRYTFKNKADMDKHKSYHIKDEQLSRDGFKKFMKSEACPFEQCRFSRVCNHIHCIRPQCNYVLHSSGQLFSHKRKHERNDTELAYRRYKQQQTSGGNFGVSPLSSSSSLSALQQHIDPNNDQSIYSMDQDYSNDQSDFAMDLTATTAAAAAAAAAAANGVLDCCSVEEQQLTSIELAYLIAASPDCCCNLGCNLDREHYHCAVEQQRCGAVLRDPREVREHLREHETQERITDAFFEEGGCGGGDDDESSCPYCADKEKHYHCNWENCREVILATDKPFRRLQHYKIHEYTRQLNLTAAAAQPLSSEVTLTHLTNIDAMFRRKRGRPPKNRVIEIWSDGVDPTSHYESPQAIFTSFKLPKIYSPSIHHHQQQQYRDNEDSREDADSDSVVTCSSNSDQDPVGFSTYGPADPCPDNSCYLRSIRHHHCSQPRCHFSTDRPDQLLMHSKDFHDNVDIPEGFAFFDRMVDCRLTTCQNNRINRHFHCTRPGCDFSFVRYSAMTLHDQQQHNIENELEITKPRIHVKNPAELIEESINDKISTTREVVSPQQQQQQEINKTTVVRAAGTFYPLVTGQPPPSEAAVAAALPGAMLSMRAPVHQEAAAAPPIITMMTSSSAAMTVQQQTSLTSLPSSSSSSSSSVHTLYGPEQSCSRPFCKLKRKNHYHCNACNQAFSELDRLVSHVAKHSAGALLQQQQEQQQQQQLDLTKHHTQHHHHHPHPHYHQHYQNQQQASTNQIKREQKEQQQQSAEKQMTPTQIVAEPLQVPPPQPPPPPPPPLPPTSHCQQQAFDLGHSFHFPSPAVMAAAMNQQIALMNQALPPFLQHAAAAAGSMYAGAPNLMFSPAGLPSNNFLPTASRATAAAAADDNNPLASLAANLNITTKRSLSPSDTSLSSSAAAAAAADAKKQRLHHSMRMLKDEPVPDGYIRFRFNEDCRYPHCGYREHQTHFHCMRQDCGYSFCDKTRFVQHTARHERLDTLMGGDFQQYRANVPCGRNQCAYTSSLGAMQNKASHFHCLKCDFVCTDTNKVVAHRRQHAKLDSIAAAGFQKFTPSQPCGAMQCQHSGKQTHYHCLQCQYAVLGLAQMSAHKYRHMDAA